MVTLLQILMICRKHNVTLQIIAKIANISRRQWSSVTSSIFRYSSQNYPSRDYFNPNKFIKCKIVDTCHLHLSSQLQPDDIFLSISIPIQSIISMTRWSFDLVVIKVLELVDHIDPRLLVYENIYIFMSNFQSSSQAFCGIILFIVDSSQVASRSRPRRFIHR